MEGAWWSFWKLPSRSCARRQACPKPNRTPPARARARRARRNRRRVRRWPNRRRSKFQRPRSRTSQSCWRKGSPRKKHWKTPRWSKKKNSSQSCSAVGQALGLRRPLRPPGCETPMKYLLASVVALAAMAQTPPSEPATCSLTGVVKEATTHVPLAGVRVWVGQPSDTTGPQGQFAFQKLESGRHWVSVYDKSRAASGGVYVLLNAGQELTGVEIYIKAGGSISGRVFDEDRQPVAGAAVVLLEATFEFGQTAYRPNLTAQTHHNGEYRLAPVPAERGYLILVKKPVKLIDSAEPMPADPEKRPRLPMPTFYPGSPDIEGGQAVTIGSSEDRRGMDIQMTSAPSYCIDGEVRTSGGAQASELTITEQLPLIFRSSLTPVTTALSEGKFRACGFHPGEYRLAAANKEGSRSQRWSALAQVVITDRDAQDVQLSPISALTLSGEAVWEPPPSGKAAEARINIGLTRFWDVGHAEEPEPKFYMIGSRIFGAHVRVPGPFTLESMPVEDYTLEVREVPEGCYVKDAAFAGASVLHQPLRLTQVTGEGRLHIALACDSGSLTARVTDRDGNPVSPVRPAVMPGEPACRAGLLGHDVEAHVRNGIA